MRNESIRYLIVPGWQGSPDNHWQSHWQRSLPNSARVEQQDWLTPQRRDWVQALEQAIAAERSPVILIAHSLGCVTVAHWAAQASPALLRRVRGALLVAPALVWSWLILLGVFVVDATFTLIHRLLRGERVYEAHRSHAYQRASRRYGSHLRVSLGVTAINTLWLMPLALLVALGHVSGLLALIVAYAPLVLVVAHLGAGRPDEQDVS